MRELRLVTATINPAMYHRFFTANPQVNAHRLVGIDNRARNLGLPALYNAAIAEALQAPDHDSWLLFVHEDFEIKDGLDVIDRLDPGMVYGTFGIDLVNGAPVPYGRHVCSDKDGSNAVEVGIAVDTPVSVSTLDCQSVLVHSSLLAARPGLRFDERLSFDLYAEDFCINARERHGLDVRVFPLRFQHYSHGNITERYHAGLRYLAAKYPDTAVPGSCSFIGGRAHELERHFSYQVRADRNASAPARVLQRLRTLARRALGALRRVAAG